MSEVQWRSSGLPVTEAKDIKQSALTLDADVVIVADVYPAGENPIKGADRDALVSGLQSSGCRHVYSLADPNSLAELIAELATVGDMVVCLGAGTITHWANALPAALDSLAAPVSVVGSSA